MILISFCCILCLIFCVNFGIWIIYVIGWSYSESIDFVLDYIDVEFNCYIYKFVDWRFVVFFYCFIYVFVFCLCFSVKWVVGCVFFYLSEVYIFCMFVFVKVGYCFLLIMFIVLLLKEIIFVYSLWVCCVFWRYVFFYFKKLII